MLFKGKKPFIITLPVLNSTVCLGAFALSFCSTSLAYSIWFMESVEKLQLINIYIFISISNYEGNIYEHVFVFR